MKTAEEIFYNKLVHYAPRQFPSGIKKAFIKAMEEYAEQFRNSSNPKNELGVGGVSKSVCHICGGTNGHTPDCTSYLPSTQRSL